MKFIILFLSICLLTNFSYCDEKLPIPRFVSIKSNQVNVRTGPSTRYPILSIIIRKNLPVEIIAEFEDWRKIRDINSDEGWVRDSMLSGKRFIIVISKENIFLLNKPSDKANKIAIIEKGAQGSLNKCEKNWCEIRFNEYKGWIAKNNLYGVYPVEEFK